MTAAFEAKASPNIIAWTDPARASAFDGWLRSVAISHGLQADSVRLASADASFRRYFRVDAAAPDTDCANSSFIIMDAPPDKEDCKPFVKVAGLMQGAGLSAPEVLAWDETAGFLLLSDLGAQTMMEALTKDIDPPPAVDALTVMVQPTPAHYEHYLAAVDALISWQLASKPGVLPPYDDALLSRELALFPEWYVAKHRGFTLDATQQATLDGAFAQIKASNLQSLEGARVYVHRDFMARNLIAPTLVASRTALPPGGALRLRPGEAGSAAPAGTNGDRLGVLDFQDAVYGPITYDIASLMRDAFLTWEEDFVLDITVRYWQKARKAGLPVGDDFGEFYRAVEWMGLQRNLKILGIFARLTLRDGKPKYLADTPRFIRYVRNTCARYRQLGPLMVLLDAIEGNETRVGYTF
ncbi:MAG: phosphotransferase [Polaromonas sp.]|nr:phosphotransferase [Polaromonas sp.]